MRNLCMIFFAIIIIVIIVLIIVVIIIIIIFGLGIGQFSGACFFHL